MKSIKFRMTGTCPLIVARPSSTNRQPTASAAWMSEKISNHQHIKIMEFEGRIIRVLPTRGGTSQRGNEWKALPFVFAYYENPDQRWEDKVLLETFDTNQMAQIAQYCEIGADHKVIVENGSVKLKTLDIKCKCGFSHNVKDVARRDGSGTATINEMRCYKLEIVGQQPAMQGTLGQAVASQSQVVFQQQPGNPQQPFPPQVDNFGYPIQPVNPGDDDLPF